MKMIEIIALIYLFSYAYYCIIKSGKIKKDIPYLANYTLMPESLVLFIIFLLLLFFAPFILLYKIIFRPKSL
jgi:hypothetical protein